MSDNEKGAEGSTSKETEWDMLSLSSSAYTEKDPAADSLFLSGHFVFPPNEHENLPIEPEVTEPEPELEPELEAESVVEQSEEQPRGSIEYQSSPEGIKYFEEGQRVTIQDSDEEETGNSSGDDNGVKNEGDGEKALPCEAWWKRHAICLYKNVKETNTIWSLLVATAVMGLVILGQRWHKEKWQVNSRWRFHFNNERMKYFGPTTDRRENAISPPEIGERMRARLSQRWTPYSFRPLSQLADCLSPVNTQRIVLV